MIEKQKWMEWGQRVPDTYGNVGTRICLIIFNELNNYTVQHENHHSGTWGDAEQESGGVCRKQFDFIFLCIFLNMSIQQCK